MRSGRRAPSTRSQQRKNCARCAPRPRPRDGSELVDISFDTISGVGPNGAIVHYRVSPKTTRAIAPDTLYLIDSGAQYRDGTTDITRTIPIGRASAEMRDRFTRVLKGHLAVAMARFPAGTSGAQIDTLARQFLWAAGLDFDHGTGHGIGSFLNVHEGPARISKLGTVPLEAGMILSDEPGYYKTGAYGIRIENLVVVTPAEEIAGGDRPMLGFETITLAPIDRRLIEPELMTPDEIAWLDAYHASLPGKLGRSARRGRAGLAGRRLPAAGLRRDGRVPAMRLACLPWYELPETRAAQDALWTVVARHLVRQGIDRVPSHLTRDRPVPALLSDPGLLFGQCCGYDVVYGFADCLTVLATPEYDAAGCEGADYRSVILVRGGFRGRRHWATSAAAPVSSTASIPTRAPMRCAPWWRRSAATAASSAP